MLVTLRTGTTAAVGDAVADRLDTAIAEIALADRLLSITAWVGYVTTTVVLGGAIYHLFVAPLGIAPTAAEHAANGALHGPARGRARRARPWTPRRSSPEAVLRAAVLVGLLAVAVSIPVRAAVVAGDGFAAATDPGNLWFVVTSRFGEAAVLRAGGLVVLVLALGQGSLRRVACFVGALVVLLSYVLIGHPQATQPVVVEVTAHAVHVAGVATWFGGVAFLALDLRQRRRERAPYPAALAAIRFSEVAELMVILVVCSGTVLAGSQLSLDTPPWATAYGQAFLAKMAFVGLVLGLGAYNHHRVVPAIEREDDAAAWRRLGQTTATEAMVIALGALLMTAAMTSGGF